MWTDSFSFDHEPSALSQLNYATSYQLFGSLGEHAQLHMSLGEHAQQQYNYATDQYMQQPSGGYLFAFQPQFPYEVWSDLNEQIKSSSEAESDGKVMWDHLPSDEQTFFTAQPQNVDSKAEVRQ